MGTFKDFRDSFQHAKVILETPYHNNTDGYQPRDGHGSYPIYSSDRTIERQYQQLFELDTTAGVVRYYGMIDAGKLIKVIGTVPATKKDGEKTNELVFRVIFKHQNTLINVPKELGDKIVQVNSASTVQEFRGEGVASYAYLELAQMGYTVLSDNSQYTDGKELWKKMARKSGVNYMIHIIDDEDGFMLADNGRTIAYDTTNIDDAIIWTTDLDFSGERKLLVLQAK